MVARYSSYLTCDWWRPSRGWFRNGKAESADGQHEKVQLKQFEEDKT